ncbi:hypothetical protein IFR05_010107 [Cadophora sp. M221]|nr:hypothetical protein IFR05_010107 [Cadophora sp. M221]
MAPTILVVGATGNTGRGVVTTVSKLLPSLSSFSDHKIIALTRSSSGSEAQKLAALPHVEVVEYNWVDITSEWLQERNIVRVFIAPHAQPNQFAEESAFHVAALNGGVEYVVRISTTAANVRPDCKAFYPRSHWAIEALLSSPEFSRLRWTSLQPNVFTSFILGPAAEFVKEFRKTGKQGPFRLVSSEDAPVGIVDANDVAVFAAQLLVEEDTTKHNKAKYVLNGPEDITGRQIVDLIEKEIGTKVEEVHFKDMSFLEWLVNQQSSESKTIIMSMRHAVESAWAGLCTASTTSKAVLELAAPKVTPAEFFKTMLG